MSSLAFAAIHAAPGAGSFVFPGSKVFILGLVTAWVVRRAGWLKPAIVFHAANNALGVFVSSAWQPRSARALMRLKTFVHSNNKVDKLDAAVNDFIGSGSIEVVKLSFHVTWLSYVVFLEYERR